jgi:hypothetical protein
MLETLMRSFVRTLFCGEAAQKLYGENCALKGGALNP